MTHDGCFIHVLSILPYYIQIKQHNPPPQTIEGMSHFYILLDSLAGFPNSPTSILFFLKFQILAAHFLDQLSLHFKKLR